jgi:hypothetical protein
VTCFSSPEQGIALPAVLACVGAATLAAQVMRCVRFFDRLEVFQLEFAGDVFPQRLLLRQAMLASALQALVPSVQMFAALLEKLVRFYSAVVSAIPQLDPVTLQHILYIIVQLALKEYLKTILMMKG